MLNAETTTENAAKAYAKLWGSKPPPINNIPPAAVIPEIALVIDINGVWSACATPQTD